MAGLGKARPALSKNRIEQPTALVFYQVLNWKKAGAVFFGRIYVK